MEPSQHDIHVLKVELHKGLENMANEIKHIRELMQIDTARLGDFERLRAEAKAAQEKMDSLAIEVATMKTRNFTLTVAVVGCFLTAIFGFLLRKM